MIRVLLTILTLLLVMQEPAKPQPGPPVVAKIHGRVTESGTGQAVAKMRVWVMYQKYSDEGLLQTAYFEDGHGVINVETDDHGDYLIEMASVGRFFLTTSSSTAAGISYQAIASPAAREISEARVIDLAEGDNLTGIDFVVSRASVASIRGKFIDGLAHRYPHWDWVWLVSRGVSSEGLTVRGGGRKVRYENAKGYEINGVPSGLYYLMSYRFDEISRRAETMIPIEVRDQDLEVDVVSEASYPLNGRFQFDGKRFSLQSPIVQLSIRCLSGMPLSTPSADFYPAGMFSFDPLPAGSYRLSILGVPPPFYVKSARFGTGPDVLDKGITLPRRDSESLVIAIGSNSGEIQGTVEGAAGAQVVLIPNARPLLRPDLYKVTKVNPNGQFEIRGIAPGEYKLYAWKDASLRQYFDEEFMRRYLGKGIAVQVESGAALHVDLPLLN